MNDTQAGGFARARYLQLRPGVFVLQAPSFAADPEIGRALRRTLNVCLLVDDGTVTLVDAGLPGVLPALTACLDGIGLGLDAVRRVVVTHSHIDHVGGLPEIVAATGAEVWAHRDDAGVIDGSVEPPDVSALVAGLRARLEVLLVDLAPDKRELVLRAAGSVYPTEHVAVDLRLVGGEELAVLGGCRLLHTPGHTPGHLSLFLPALSLLVAGDLLTFEAGHILPSSDALAVDPALLHESVRAVAALPVDAFIGYHGGWMLHGAGALLRGAGGA